MLDLTNVAKYSDEEFELGPIQTKWLEALESGNYEQGQGKLRSLSLDTKDKPRFCCLGVLCDVMGLEFQDFSQEAYEAGQAQYYGYKLPDQPIMATVNGYMSYDMAIKAGLREGNGGFRQAVSVKPEKADGEIRAGSLAECNDAGANHLSFAEIAQLIRHDPYNVFAVSA